MPPTAEIRALTPTTVAGLLALVEPFGPAVEDGTLVFDRDPPMELLPALGILHTGIRAALSSRRWYGCDGNTGRVVELRLVVPIPVRITLLCVEGDPRWDRIRADGERPIASEPCQSVS